MIEDNSGGSIRASNKLSIAIKNYYKCGDHVRRYMFVKNLCRGKKVLDYGCGYGFGGFILRSEYARYIGVDIDHDAINWAEEEIKSICPKASFFQSMTFEEQFSSQYFDIVISFEVLEHVHEPAGLLRSLKKKVVPGGKIILSTPNGSFAKGDSSLFSTKYHIYEYTANELMSLLEQNIGGNIQFYKEERVDKVSNIWRTLLAEGRKARLRDLRSSKTLTPNNNSSFRNSAYRLLAEHYNSAFFWTIRPLSKKEFDSPGFSCIIAVIDM